MTEPPMLVNLDSFAELDRYPSGEARLGLRVNPELRPDTISSLATGVAGSKFGVPISQRAQILAAFDAEPRLTARHRVRSVPPPRRRQHSEQGRVRHRVTRAHARGRARRRGLVRS